jgi:small GTP-binding protein
MASDFISNISRVNKKIIVGGDGGVGKTALLDRYPSNDFNSKMVITKRIQIFTKSIIIDKEKINFTFWDYAGEKRWRFFQSDFCKGADGAILTFDLTHWSSFENLKEWVILCRSGDPNLPILLLGMKNDLSERIAVTDKYTSDIKDNFNLFDYIKVSSKSGENVQKAFQSLFSHILKIPREKIPVIKYIDDRTKKIERMLLVSNRIKLDMMRTALNMEKKAFDEKIFEWAEEFGFIIDKDIIIIDIDTISDYINKLDIMFETWEKSETKKLS